LAVGGSSRPADVPAYRVAKIRIAFYAISGAFAALRAVPQ
jgi:ribose/xylose/arabinose/galactoside ABC-type transport system permease subunit